MRSVAFIIFALLAGVAAADQERPRMLGRYLAREDSLGFDEYRQLPAKEQLRRRGIARNWVREGNELKERGLDEFATAVGMDPYVPEAWLRYGEAQLLRGHDEAADYCARTGLRVLRFEPNLKTRNEIERGLHAVRAYVAYNLGDLEACVDAVYQALALEPDDRELQLQLARAQGGLGRFADARQTLSAFDVTHPAYARAQGVLGTVELAAGRLAAAREAFRLAYEFGLRGAVFENDRGRLELESGDDRAAISHFEESIRLRPDFMEARSNLAVAQRRMGDLAGARRSLEESLEVRPDYGPAHFNLAELLRELARQAPQASALDWRESALRHYGEALRAGYDPERVIERRARLAAELNRLDEAERDFLEITNDPDIDGDVLHRLARVKREQGEYRIALELLEMAAQRGYDAPELHSDLGELYLRGGEVDAAIRELELALQGDSELLITRVNLSIAYAQSGDLDAAERELQAAEAKDPGHELVRAQRIALDAQRGQ